MFCYKIGDEVSRIIMIFETGSETICTNLVGLIIHVPTAGITCGLFINIINGGVIGAWFILILAQAIITTKLILSIPLNK